MVSYDKKNNTWRADISVRGKRIRKRGFITKNAAELYEAQMRVKSERQLLGLPTQDKLVEVRTVIDNYKKASAIYKKDSTLIRERTALKAFDEFLYRESIKYCNEFHNDSYQKYIQHRLGEGKAKLTINKEIVTISLAFKHSIESGLISNNPFAKAKLFRVPKNNTPRFFSLHELETIERIAKEKHRTLWRVFFILVRTGLRVGEYCSLTASDIDFDRNIIRVRAETTKTATARNVPFSEAVAEVLRDSIAHAERAGKKQIAVNSRDNNYTRSGVLQGLRSVLRKAAKEGVIIEGVNVHTFRKTYISHLVMQGEDIVKVMHIVGHKKYDTMKIYLSLAPDYLSDVKELPY